jgi:hypothetical protein
LLLLIQSASGTAPCVEDAGGYGLGRVREQGASGRGQAAPAICGIRVS